MADFWEQWGEKKGTAGPVPPGIYTATLDAVVLNHDANGQARTELTLGITGGNHHGRLVWVSWPHIGAKFGWLAHKAWTAAGLNGRPSGDTEEAVFQTVAQVLVDQVRRQMRITTDLRTYRNPQGEQISKARVKDMQPIFSEPVGGEPTAQAEEAPHYGGRDDAPSW